jgi:hypothetical protein
VKKKPQHWGMGPHYPLVKSGAIESCPDHSDVFVRTHDREAERLAYAIGTNMVKAENAGDSFRKCFMEAIADTLAQTNDKCFICEAAEQWK